MPETESPKDQPLSRREREIMEIIYRLGEATAAEVRPLMDTPPTNAAVRATLRILVEKEHLAIELDGPRYVYQPTVSREAASRSALRHLVQTFFGGSTRGAMVALLEEDQAELGPSEKRRLLEMIAAAEREGR